jgi:hypothetical protein
MIRRCLQLTFLFLLCPLMVQAQFGGRPGDVVMYLVTTRGNADFRIVTPPVANDAQTAARFYITPVDSLPLLRSDPFPILRQTPYETPDETFMVGTDVEQGHGIHRLVLVPVKFFLKEGVLFTPVATALQGMWFNGPQGIDVEGDVALTTDKIIFWAPMKWPFLMPYDGVGPGNFLGLTGFETLGATPGAIRVFSLIPWVNFSSVYAGAGWPAGVDMKLIDDDPKAGDVMRIIRIRPGKTTPTFRLAGHTHVLVLQGSATLTPAGSNPITIKDNDYVFLPENFAVKISNPAQYAGPGAP